MPRYRDIPEPRMVALYTANGSGTKLYQGFLDGHPQLYMIPAYPLMYFYPHWHEWERDLADRWSWPAIIDTFCIRHASVIDTRRIPGHDGLAALGEGQNEFIAIDETRFRRLLEHMLEDEPISARRLLLAAHYAYAICRGEDLAPKRALLYHVHVHEYVERYLIGEFPDMLVLGTIRDPRANFRGRYESSEAGVDMIKMNATDAMVYRRRVYYFIMRYFYEGLDIMRGFPIDRLRVIRHEDLLLRPEGVMAATAAFLGIDHDPCLATITFGNRQWWGDKVYDMEPMNRVNPNITSDAWKKRTDRIDWFVFEGLFFRYLERYGYALYRYRTDSWRERLLLLGAIFLPSAVERRVLMTYLSGAHFADFLAAARAEASGAAPFKDYGFNAYYRHKWTQKDLRLNRLRWHVRLLLWARRRDALIGTSRAIYVAWSLARYAWTIACWPVTLVRRWGVHLAAYRRLVTGRNVLPEIL
jgi:hypothetical protein